MPKQAPIVPSMTIEQYHQQLTQLLVNYRLFLEFSLRQQSQSLPKKVLKMYTTNHGDLKIGALVWNASHRDKHKLCACPSDRQHRFSWGEKAYQPLRNLAKKYQQLDELDQQLQLMHHHSVEETIYIFRQYWRRNRRTIFQTFLANSEQSCWPTCLSFNPNHHRAFIQSVDKLVLLKTLVVDYQNGNALTHRITI